MGRTHPEHVLNYRLDESREKARRRDRAGQTDAGRVEQRETTKSPTCQPFPGRPARGHLVIPDAYIGTTKGCLVANYSWRTSYPQ